MNADNIKDKLNLTNAVISVVPDPETHSQKIQVQLTFNNVMFVSDSTLKHFAEDIKPVLQTLAHSMREEMLAYMLTYLEEHNARGLATLKSKARFEGMEMVRGRYFG